MYTSYRGGRSQRYTRKSLVFDVFKRLLLEEDIDTEQALLQVFKDDLSKMGGDVQLCCETKRVFGQLYNTLKCLREQECNKDEHDAALRALAGCADYLPCHPLAAMKFVLEHTPKFVEQGGTATSHLPKGMLRIIECFGLPPSKYLLVRFCDKSKMTQKDGYASDLFRIVFTLYYWPYAKIESIHSLSVLPDYSKILICRSNLCSVQKRQLSTESGTTPMSPTKRRKPAPCMFVSIQQLDSFSLDLSMYDDYSF